MGTCVGEALSVGDVVGTRLSEGVLEGEAVVGLEVGEAVGALVGRLVGRRVGFLVGAFVGRFVGFLVGALEGFGVGCTLTPTFPFATLDFVGCLEVCWFGLCVGFLLLLLFLFCVGGFVVGGAEVGTLSPMFRTVGARVGEVWVGFIGTIRCSVPCE